MTREEYLQLRAAGALPATPAIGFGARLDRQRNNHNDAIERYFNRSRGNAPASSGGAGSAGGGVAFDRGGAAGGGDGRGSDGQGSTNSGAVGSGQIGTGVSLGKGAIGAINAVGGFLGIPGLGYMANYANDTINNADPTNPGGRGAVNGMDHASDTFGKTGVDTSGVGAGGPSLGPNESAPGTFGYSSTGEEGNSNGPSTGPSADPGGYFGGGYNGDGFSGVGASGVAGGDGGWGDASGIGGSSVDGGYSGDGLGYARGGRVVKGRMVGPDPKGPDDGYIGADEDEYMIKAARAKKLGFRKLEALNEGRAKIVMIGAKK